MANRIVVCGKGTVLGNAFASYLKKKGYELTMLSADDLTRTPAPMLAKHIDGCYAVCNTAGADFVAKWSDRYVHDIYCSRMLSIRAVIESLRYCENKPKVVLQLSNAMIYDQYEVHDDFSVQYGETFTSEVAQMETKETMKLRKRFPEVRLVLVRCGYIMSKSHGLFSLLKRLFRRKISGYVGDGYQCIPMIHIDDAIKAGEMFINNDNANGIFNLTIPEMASLRELSEAFSSRDKSWHLPFLHIFVRILTGRAIALLEQNCKVEPKRLQGMGFVFQYPNVDSIVESLY